jgi:hypothetical protein
MTKSDKKNKLRNEIISASKIYRDNLAGKVFLYVVGEDYFEVSFQTDRFMHLTGVNSSLKARDFYEKAKASVLTTNQFYFDSNHRYDNAKRKINCLQILPSLTNSIVCALKDLSTITLTYKIGITNIDFTIGLTENIDFNGNKINDWFLPRTMRVGDKSIENSSHSEFVDFIFSKDASHPKYNTLSYADEGKIIPASVIPLLAENLIQSFVSRDQKNEVNV